MTGIASETTNRKDLSKSDIRKHEENVLKVIETLNHSNNPFDGTHTELINIWWGVVASEKCSSDLQNAYTVGEKALYDFFQNDYLRMNFRLLIQ